MKINSPCAGSWGISLNFGTREKILLGFFGGFLMVCLFVRFLIVLGFFFFRFFLVLVFEHKCHLGTKDMKCCNVLSLSSTLKKKRKM